METKASRRLIRETFESIHAKLSVVIHVGILNFGYVRVRTCYCVCVCFRARVFEHLGCNVVSKEIIMDYFVMFAVTFTWLYSFSFHAVSNNDWNNNKS